ncbi:hypothetical protein PM082_015905 [Marasmius tenuissimus]|nr:hypothetical protein PM082_015905 [Marasmius tenuissimus]
MTTLSDLLPEPILRDLPAPGCRVGAIGKILEGQGTMENSEYTKFKEHTRELARLYLSQPTLHHKKQPSGEWQQFASKMAVDYPFLERYQNRWPLIYYFNEWTSSQARAMSWSMRIRKTKARSKDKAMASSVRNHSANTSPQSTAKDLTLMRSPESAACQTKRRRVIIHASLVSQDMFSFCHQ